jgi:hypothetical protein
LINSSSLPVLDGALESSKGLAKGLFLLLTTESEDQLDRREDARETGEASGESSSRYRRARAFEGGRSSSAESAAVGWLLYSERFEGECRSGFGCEYWLEVSERVVDVVLFAGEEKSVRILRRPELRRTCGVGWRGAGGMGDDLWKGLFEPI